LAIAFTGIIAAIYGVIYYFNVQDTPPGKVYKKPERHGSIEVTSKGDFWLENQKVRSMNTIATMYLYRK
jgi:NNP family nitrate/nitrite transporter-like MFS transporter